MLQDVLPLDAMKRITNNLTANEKLLENRRIVDPSNTGQIAEEKGKDDFEMEKRLSKKFSKTLQFKPGSDDKHFIGNEYFVG